VIYFPTIHRWTTTERFDLGFSVVAPLALLAALWVGYHIWAGDRRRLAAAAVLVAAALDAGFGLSLASLFMVAAGLLWGGDRSRFVRALCLALAFFNGLGVAHYGVLVPMGVWSPLEGVALLQLRVHYALGYLAPLLVLAFMFSWLLKPLVRLSGFKLQELEVEERGVDRFSVALLLFSVYVALYAAVYPYFPSVNPLVLEVGVDVPHYVRWFEAGVDWSRIFFFGVYVVFKGLTGLDVASAFRFMPVLLNPLFVLASYYFGWECFRNSRVAAWCAFLSATGYVVTVGMYAYFLSNTLALSLVLVSLGLLFRAIRVNDVRVLALASLFGCLLVFTHPWTLDQYLAGLVPLIGYLWYRKEQGYLNTGVYMGGYLLQIGLAEVAKTVVLRSVGGATATVTATSGLIGLGEFWFSSIFSFRYLYGGFMSNVVLLGLAAVGVYFLCGRRLPERYLYVLVLLSSLVFFFSDETNKSRLLYNVPLGLFGSVALDAFLEKRGVSFMVFFVAFSLFYLFLSVGNVVWAS